MEAVFLKILHMSLTATWLALAVMLLRPLLKKAPRWITVAMWALVGIRLLCPVAIESSFSLTPDTETVVADFVYAQQDIARIDHTFATEAMDPVISQLQNPTLMTKPTLHLEFWAAVVWLSGVAVMLGYSLVSYLLLRRKVRVSLRQTDNIYFCDSVDTPFILGMIRPKIYLPSGIDPNQIAYVTAHEKAHLKRKDHWWKPLGFALLALHWFNPVLWVAYVLLCRDIELACDEKVVKHADVSYRAGYSRALLDCSIRRRSIMACPLAFGEVGVKTRIKSVLHYKKPAIWIILAAVVLCSVVAVCLLTDPVRSVDAKMEIFIDCQIAEHNQTEHSVGNACVLDWQVLGKEKKGNKTTVYLWVLYEEYTQENGQLKLESGSHLPTVITAEKKDGQYFPVEYWTPRDGAYYEQDIREKFPWHLEGKALDSQRYIKQQKTACRKLAQEHFEMEGSILSSATTPKPIHYKQAQDAMEAALAARFSRGAIVGERQHLYTTYHYLLLGQDRISGTPKEGGEHRELLTQYLLVLHMTYEIMGDRAEEHHGSWYPTIVTTAMDSDGNHTVTEYWSSEVEAQVRERFPKELADLAYGEKQATELLSKCQTEASRYAVSYEPTPEELKNLRTKYPQFFDLDTSKGLRVLVWQMSPYSYSCALAPREALTELPGLEKSASMAEMRKIVASYKLDKENVEIRGINMPHSSYWYEIDEAYTKQVEHLFWEGGSALTGPLVIVDNKTGEVLAATSIPEEDAPEALRKAVEELRNSGNG